MQPRNSYLLPTGGVEISDKVRPACTPGVVTPSGAPGGKNVAGGEANMSVQPIDNRLGGRGDL